MANNCWIININTVYNVLQRERKEQSKIILSIDIYITHIKNYKYFAKTI